MPETALATETIAGNEVGFSTAQIAGDEYGLSGTVGVPCNSCDPPLPDTLYITLAGLAGDFAQYNGKHTAPWTSGCTWGLHLSQAPLHDLWVGYDVTQQRWEAVLFLQANCTKGWIQNDAVGCSVTGSYSEFSCTAAGPGSGDCADPNTCADSVGATCVVTLV